MKIFTIGLIAAVSGVAGLGIAHLYKKNAFQPPIHYSQPLSISRPPQIEPQPQPQPQKPNISFLSSNRNKPQKAVFTRRFGVPIIRPFRYRPSFI